MVENMWYVEVFPLDDHDSRVIKVLILINTYHDEIYWSRVIFGYSTSLWLLQLFLVFTSIAYIVTFEAQNQRVE